MFILYTTVLFNQQQQGRLLQQLYIASIGVTPRASGASKTVLNMIKSGFHGSYKMMPDVFNQFS